MPILTDGIRVTEASVSANQRWNDFITAGAGAETSSIAVSAFTETYGIGDRQVYMHCEVTREAAPAGEGLTPFYNVTVFTAQAALELARELHAAAVRVLEAERTDAEQERSFADMIASLQSTT